MAIDTSKLGKDFKTWAFNSDWTGSEDDSISSGIASRIMGDPELLKQLGLTADDIKLVNPAGYQHDSYVPGQYTISDKARQALTGLTMSRTGYEGIEDGRSQVLRDAKGNVLSIGDAYSYDPAGDLKENLLRGAALMAAAYGGGQLLGVEGAGAGAASGAGTGASTGAASGAGAGSAGGIGSLGVEGQLAADLASLGGGTAAGTGSVNAALMEAMAGGAGYGSSGASLAAGIAPGVSAGTTAVNAAMNPYLNALGKLSPELASSVAGGTGGIGGLLGPAADALLPASVLSKVGGGDGSSGGLSGIFGGGGSGSKDSSWMDYILPLMAGYASYKDAKKPQLTGYTGSIAPKTATQTVEQGKYGPISRTSFAVGGGIPKTGIADAGVPRYLDSAHDGMQDTIPAHIDGKEPAALSGGEFVIPADVVSHLGNGNSNAGAQQLFKMMDRVRAHRTGTTKQGKQINPDSFMPV